MKFGIDKRKAPFIRFDFFLDKSSIKKHCSNFKKPIYPKELLSKNKEFVVKNLGISTVDSETNLKAPTIPHSQYAMNLKFFDKLKFLYASN